MFLPRVQLLRNKRPGRLSQNPFLRQFPRLWIISNLHTRWQSVHIFHKMVIEEGHAAFNGMRHFGAVGEVREEHVWESGLVPDVLGGV